MAKQKGQWITVKGKHLLIDTLKSGGKTSKSKAKKTPMAKFDEIQKQKKNK